MHGTTRPRTTVHPAATGAHAVVWVGPGRAVIVRGVAGEEPATIETVIPDRPTAMPSALADVAHRIGEVDRVLVLGADDLRTALEREIVAIGHRPETIRDAVVEGPVDTAVLLEKLRRLAQGDHMLVIDGVPIRRRLGSAYAHARRAEALFEVAREGVDPALAGPAAPAARAWLRVALAGPITRATDAALDRFCAELELIAQDAPAELRAALGLEGGEEPVTATERRLRYAREAAGR